jgi:hypothetical protein
MEISFPAFINGDFIPCVSFATRCKRGIVTVFKNHGMSVMLRKLLAVLALFSKIFFSLSWILFTLIVSGANTCLQK